MLIEDGKGPVSVEQFESMRNELKGWTSLMAYADLVLSKLTSLYTYHFMAADLS